MIYIYICIDRSLKVNISQFLVAAGLLSEGFTARWKHLWGKISRLGY